MGSPEGFIPFTNHYSLPPISQVLYRLPCLETLYALLAYLVSPTIGTPLKVILRVSTSKHKIANVLCYV